MGHITQKVIHLIESGQVVADLMPLAHYSFSFLDIADPSDEMDFDIRVSEFIDIYRVREYHLSLNNIDHGGFLETINFLKQINSPVVNMLSMKVSGYLFVFLLEVETETIVGILYVKQ
jgi:hypothetical protein